MVSKNNIVKTFIGDNLTLMVTLIFLTLLTFFALFIALEKHKVAKAYEVKHTEKVSKLGRKQEQPLKLKQTVTKAVFKNTNNIHTKSNVDKLCLHEIATLAPEAMFVRHTPNMIRKTSFLIENDLNEFKVSAFFNKGVTKDMLHVAIEEGFLIVKVKQKEQNKVSKDKLMNKFVSLTVMQKVILIPNTADILKAKVVYENNVLKVVIPKIEKSSRINKQFSL
ncbi:MAG: Hsp20/alpha crystallin family protein [Proteobacteria bacterium]|nr:Hsp20/alpha crystallin family protein [Pseudomonadota bacterium]